MQENKLYEVRTPNANFNGRRFGVLFKNGVGTATEKQARVLVQGFKYSCPQLDVPTEKDKAPEEKPAVKPQVETAKVPAGTSTEKPNTSAKSK